MSVFYACWVLAASSSHSEDLQSPGFLCGILNLNVKSCLSPCGSAIEWPLVQTERFHLKTAGTTSSQRSVLPKFILVPSVKRHRGKIIPTIRHSVLCSTVLSFLFIHLFIYQCLCLTGTTIQSNRVITSSQLIRCV